MHMDRTLRKIRGFQQRKFSAATILRGLSQKIQILREHVLEVVGIIFRFVKIVLTIGFQLYLVIMRKICCRQMKRRGGRNISRRRRKRLNEEKRDDMWDLMVGLYSFCGFKNMILMSIPAIYITLFSAIDQLSITIFQLFAVRFNY